MSAFLFVPANKPDRFIKACNSGAKAIILDLEDTIAPNEKKAARQHIAGFDFNKHKACTHQELWLRINNNEELNNDLEFIKNNPNIPIHSLIIPKSENKNDLQAIFDDTHIKLIALIETTKGLTAIQDIASATGIRALSFGVLDLANALGVALDTAGAKAIFDRVRYELVLASSLNGLEKPIETIFKDFKDTDGFFKHASFCHQMGFGGQLCIHPAQVSLTNIAYQANDDQLALASEILEKFHKTGEYAFSVQGMMVDLPLIEWAKNLTTTHQKTSK